MRVVVSGDAGFVGSHLREAPFSRQEQVVGLDNNSTASPDNIAHLTDHPALKFLDTDISIAVDVRGQVDIVVHLASPAASPDYRHLSLETLTAGSHGTQNMLNLQRLRSRMRHDDGQVVSSFITQALNSDPLNFYGDGSQTVVHMREAVEYARSIVRVGKLS